MSFDNSYYKRGWCEWGGINNLHTARFFFYPYRVEEKWNSWSNCFIFILKHRNLRWEQKICHVCIHLHTACCCLSKVVVISQVIKALYLNREDSILPLKCKCSPRLLILFNIWVNKESHNKLPKKIKQNSSK